MKRIIAFIFSLYTIGSIAQQQEQYSLYMMNNFLVNPAEGGTEEFIDIKMGYRTQWVGLEGAPKNVFVSGHAALGKKTSRFDDVKQMAFHAVGAVVQTDRIGVWDVLDLKGSYAYHLPVSNKLTVSLGTFLGVKQYGYKAKNAEYEYDPATGQGINNDASFGEEQSKLVPDLTLGLWAYSSKYYFGISAFQLLGNKIDYTAYKGSSSTTEQASQAELARHYWVTGGYRFPIGENFNLVPSFVMKVVTPTPPQFDINAKLRYQDKYWIGVSYRNLDAAVFLAGVTLKKIIDVAYAYDANISNLNNHNGGSHEIMIGLRLPNQEHEPAPSQFW